MIDDEDGDFVLLMWPSGGPWWFVALGIVLAGIVYMIAASNSADCAKRTCSAGSVAKLLDHECVCVSEPK